MTEKKTPLIIYHARCMDGLVAFWAALRRWPDAEGYPAHHGSAPPYDLAAERMVLIVDFSYPRAQLLELQARAEVLIVLDHHKTAREDLEGLEFCLFDMDKSGARLAWEWACPGAMSPKLIDYVEDRDLWRWKLPNSKEINASLRALEPDVAMLDQLRRELAHSPSEHIVAGRAILRAQEQMVQQHLGRAERWAIWLPNRIDKVEVWGVNASVLPSEIGGALASAEGSPGIGMTYYRKADGEWLYSLRSRSDLDCSHIAKALGGGGHAQAAGFRGPFSPDETNSPFESLGPAVQGADA